MTADRELLKSAIRELEDDLRRYMPNIGNLSISIHGRLVKLNSILQEKAADDLAELVKRRKTLSMIRDMISRMAVPAGRVPTM